MNQACRHRRSTVNLSRLDHVQCDAGAVPRAANRVGSQPFGACSTLTGTLTNTLIAAVFMPSQGPGMHFAKALAAHKQGKLSEAEALYSEILKANPADFHSMHLLGVIALQTERTGR